MLRLAALASLFAIAACQTQQQALEAARQRLAGVRPGSALGDVHLVGWDSPLAAAALRGDAAGAVLSLPFARAMLAAHGPTLERLGLGEPGAFADLRRNLLEQPDWIAAFVLPAAAAIVVREQPVLDVDLLAHELAHHASWRRGYWQRGEQLLALRDGPLDPDWVDLDAWLGCWALEEGIAELSARAAGGAVAEVVRQEAARPVAFAPPVLLSGPGVMQLGNRRYELAAGEQRLVEHEPGARVLELAYGFGLRYAAAAQAGAATLEAGFAAAWERFPATTRAILATAPDDGRSALAAALRQRRGELSPPPAAATRVGAFFVLQGLSQRREPAAALATALALADDLLLRWPDGSLLWLTCWREPAAAAAFAEFAGGVEGADVQRDDDCVLVAVGAPPAAARAVLPGWLRGGATNAPLPSGGR